NLLRISFLICLLISLTNSACKPKRSENITNISVSISTGHSELMASLYGENGRFEGFSPEQELLEKRTANSKHFRNNDGTFTVQVGGIMHYRDIDGQWKDIDLTISEGTPL